MEISSSSLFHHKSEFKYFMDILKSGFEHRTMDESLPFSPSSSSAFNPPGIIRYDFKFKAVCFTDLPSDKIEPHINQYGEYIIGLTKDWGKANEITPIRYVHHYTPDIINDKSNIIRNFVENYPDSKSEIIDVVNKLMASAGLQEKITSEDISNLPVKFQYLVEGYNQIITEICFFIYSHFGLMRIYEGHWEDRVTGETNYRRFYDEREWRSLDINGEKGNLTFIADNIDEIYVPSEKEKEIVVSFFKENQDRFKIDNFEKFEKKVSLTSKLLN